jgi:hypothetical protein
VRGTVAASAVELADTLAVVLSVETSDADAMR